MARLCKKAGIKPFGFHALRRFVASVLDSKNVPLKQIQLILGHSKPTTTDRYIANIKSGMKEAMNHLSLGKVPRRGTPEKKEVNEKSR